MTLDRAQERYEVDPCYRTAWRYFEVAKEYLDDEMITEDEYNFIGKVTEGDRGKAL